MHTFRKKSLIFAAVSPIVSMLAFAAEQSPGGLEEVVVTAQKREQNLQEIPFAITALGQAQIESQGLDDLVDYMQYVPGMFYSVVTEGPRGGQNLIIRGITNSRIFSADVGSAAVTTGFYLGEVPVQTVDPKLYDINRIEVLKGPQGTLFGAASMGGTVRLIPNDPKADAFEASIDLDYSLTDSAGDNIKANGMLNVPLIEDVLAARLVLMGRDEDGYIDLRPPNIGNGIRTGAPPASPATPVNNVIKGVNDEQTTGFRVALKYTPNDRLTIKPSYYFQEVEYGSGFDYDKSLGQGLVSERYQPQPKNTEFTLSSLEASYRLDGSEIILVASNYERDYTEVEDTTTFIASIFDSLGTGEIPALSSLDGDISTRSNTYELRWQSNGEQSGYLANFDWVVGLYYYEEERDFNLYWHAPGYNENATPGNEIPGPDTNIFTQIATGDDDNFSQFMDLSFHLTDKWTISGGVRHFDMSQATSRTNSGALMGNPVNPQAQVLTSEEKGWTPRYNVSFKASGDALLFFTASRGFRAGGGNAPVVTPECIDAVETLGLQSLTKQYESDKIWNYELGAKTSWLDNRLVVNGSIYQIDWTDLQQGVFLGALGSTCTRVLTGNVGEATSKGIDIEFTYLPFESLTLSGTISYNEARLGTPDPLAAVGEKDDVLQGVPDEMYSFSAQYDFPAYQGYPAYARLDWTYTGERSSVLGWTDNPWDRQKAYSLTNIRVGVDINGWAGELYIDNVFDEAPELSSIPKLGEESFTRLVGTSRPRSVGLNIRRFFR